MANVGSKGQSMISRVWTQVKPKIGAFSKYAKDELAPPTIGDISAMRESLKKIIKNTKNGSFKNITVREAWLNTLVTMEVCFWFYVGECIGKRHLVGYKV
ncbi:ATP synthase subunit g, mitochondrial-like [Glossina fuscipes]|uniref:ATP synthase subunit g n=1 Tax=Glossina fuscipes TaxID=7396 RepID=A0A9C6DL51_9MUSC|nr:ATP synthase subunit g, mitochondrial-like [Glossina fuscipes]